MGYNPKELLQASEVKKYEWIAKLERYTQCCALKHHIVHMPSTYEFVPLTSLCRDFVPVTTIFPFPIGFLWHDFVVNPHDPSFYKQTRGLQCNKALTEDFLDAVSTENVKLFGIIRAHQHTPDNNDPMMNLLFASNGCASLWQERNTKIHVRQGMVLTLLLSPDSLHGMPNPKTGYTGFDYDTYAIVTTGAKLSDWSVDVINTPSAAAA